MYANEATASSQPQCFPGKAGCCRLEALLGHGGGRERTAGGVSRGEASRRAWEAAAASSQHVLSTSALSWVPLSSCSRVDRKEAKVEEMPPVALHLCTPLRREACLGVFPAGNQLFHRTRGPGTENSLLTRVPVSQEVSSGRVSAPLLSARGCIPCEFKE